ncbi:hypothetical protein, partial [Pseudomonas aeruginosa]|uniref:hypothetical protein n=1 Tax=Pseudomonas aeruginosa TaxID=287 RepID=UPI002341D0C5
MTTLKKSLHAARFIAATALLIVFLPQILSKIMPIFSDISEIIVRTAFAPLTTFIDLLAKFHTAHGTPTTLVLLVAMFTTILFLVTRNNDKKN